MANTNVLGVSLPDSTVNILAFGTVLGVLGGAYWALTRIDNLTGVLNQWVDNWTWTRSEIDSDVGRFFDWVTFWD